MEIVWGVVLSIIALYILYLLIRGAGRSGVKEAYRELKQEERAARAAEETQTAAASQDTEAFMERINGSDQ